MSFLHHVWRFLGGLFLVNAVPHLTHGISGHAFQSPFATPPGQGLSSPIVNVCWGCCNLVIAYIFIYKATRFDIRLTSHAAPIFVGILCGALIGAHFFGQIYTPG